MTDGSSGAPENGAGGPAQDDDVFAYLYRPAEGEEGAERAPVAPRNAYQRPMEVGRAQYGQQQPYRQYPQQQPPQQHQQGQRPQGPGAESTTQLPQQSRYAERSRPAPGEDTPRGRGKGPVIGVVAVVAAIAIGSGIALSGNDAKDTSAGGHPVSSTGSTHAGSSGSPGSTSPSASPSPSAGQTGSAGSVLDASKAQAQNAPSANTIKGAVSSDGSYLTLQTGSSVTWTVTVPTAGKYKFWIHFNNSGDLVQAAVAVNGTDRSGGVPFKNYGAKGADPTQSWYSTNIWPDLQAGTNTLTVSAPSGGSVLIDQVAVTTFDVNSYPTGGAAPAPASS
ncbi:hypothetical protein P3T37_003290 [Kitasatospora sp. MAA4]|uniref:hypothetical protein n=1 Tax=Kitasatospora sp. MAA4 TaxID=3035093 RepID=UPI0024746021|nr:hypothetical protein [Kitasatospora sp. MAA4]MDH6133891.1 hypothetical protein [Kitasatospora sp. MAA4]